MLKSWVGPRRCGSGLQSSPATDFCHHWVPGAAAGDQKVDPISLAVFPPGFDAAPIRDETLIFHKPPEPKVGFPAAPGCRWLRPRPLAPERCVAQDRAGRGLIARTPDREPAAPAGAWRTTLLSTCQSPPIERFRRRPGRPR